MSCEPISSTSGCFFSRQQSRRDRLSPSPSPKPGPVGPHPLLLPSLGEGEGAERSEAGVGEGFSHTALTSRSAAGKASDLGHPPPAAPGTRPCHRPTPRPAPRPPGPPPARRRAPRPGSQGGHPLTGICSISRGLTVPRRARSAHPLPPGLWPVGQGRLSARTGWLRHAGQGRPARAIPRLLRRYVTGNIAVSCHHGRSRRQNTFRSHHCR